MKFRFESDDDLSLGKIRSIPIMIIDVRSVFQKENKISSKRLFTYFLFNVITKYSIINDNHFYDAFSFGILLPLKIGIYFISIWPYFCLYVFVIITTNRFTIKFYIHETTNSFPYLSILFNSSLSTALIHNGLMSSLSIHPM